MKRSRLKKASRKKARKRLMFTQPLDEGIGLEKLEKFIRKG